MLFAELVLTGPDSVPVFGVGIELMISPHCLAGRPTSNALVGVLTL
jgi:hypothetical protein